MKPDEDYEDIESNTYVGNSRAMSWVVLAVAIGGFATLAYYAYHSASSAKNGDGSMVVEADATPIKQAPANPEGEQFANKDKTIYDVIAPDGSKQTEKLMPEPERPVAAADNEDEDSIAASKEPTTGAPVVAAQPAPAPQQATAPAPAVAPAPAKPVEAKVIQIPEQPKPAPASQTTTTYVAEDHAAPAAAPAPAATPAPAAPTQVAEAPVATKAVPATYAAPKMVNEKPATAKKDDVKAAKPEKKAAATAPAAGGSYKVQLGAYASEAEAQGAWKKITGKFAGVLSGAPTIVKADVNGKTFYRLRAGSYASSADAKAECAKLVGTPCMPVK